MVEVHARTREANGVALVECRLANDEPEARRVVIESRLDGPTWPPREGDVPDPRWNGDRAEFVVDAGRTVGVGFAALAPAREPPVAVVEAEPVDAGEAGDGLEPRGSALAGETSASLRGTTPPAETTAASVAGKLTDARPPLRGVLEEESDGATGDDAVLDAGGCPVNDAGDPPVGDRPSPGGSADAGARPACPGIDRDRPVSPGIDRDRPETPTAEKGRADLPGGWLDDVEARTERLEALATARSLPAATEAVAAAGGLEGVRDGVATARADRDRLLVLAARARTLAGRIEAADVPVETLERLS